MTSLASEFIFDKSRRLLKATQYDSIFSSVDYKVSSKEILCLSKSNHLDHPRLGLIIAKKNVRHAVQRNRVKRIIRESFRLNQHNLPAVDIVILARKGLDELNNAEIHNEISEIWKRLIKKINKSQQS